MRKQEEINVEIAELTRIKPRVRRRSAFGEDHHEAIDMQLDVLRGKWSEDKIYKEAGDDTDDEFMQNILDAGLEARRWLDGQKGEDAPSVGWQELIIK